MDDITRARKTIGLGIAGLLAGGLFLAPNVVGAEPAPADWDTVVLAPLAEGQDTVVTDINNDGRSVGSSGDTPVRWDADGVPTALALPEGCETGQATTVNEDGESAGWAVCSGSSFHRGVAWAADGTVTGLETPLEIADRSDNDLVVGQRNAASLSNDQAFGFYGGVRYDLPTYGADSSVANSVTEYGFVVGTLEGVPTLADSVAVGWYGNAAFPLVLGDQATEGVDVTEGAYSLVQIREAGNDRGVIVEPTLGAVLPLNADGANDVVVDINEAGITVGARQLTAESLDTEGLFYLVSGQVQRLDDLPSDEDAAAYVFDAPAALNDGAWVVGNHDGVSWLLKPAAEAPTTTTTAAPTTTTTEAPTTTTTEAPTTTTTTAPPAI